MKKVAVLILALTLGLAACGGGGGAGSGENQALADAIAAEMTADTTPGNPFAKAEDAQCFADGMVGALGVERLAALGVTAESATSAETVMGELTAEEQGKVADVALSCIDLSKAIIDGAVAAGLSEDQAQCLADSLSEDLLKQAFLSEVSGQTFDPSSDPAFMEAITACFTG